jgi:hypothetical protein
VGGESASATLNRCVNGCDALQKVVDQDIHDQFL